MFIKIVNKIDKQLNLSQRKGWLFVVAIFVIFIPSLAFGQEVPTVGLGPLGPIFSWTGLSTSIFSIFARSIAEALLILSSWILIISGAIFDWVVEFTIINLAINIGGTTGVGGGITSAWATLRDIANMCFIFVLLFAAFKAMFQLSFGSLGTTIRNIIIVALLINFSLFFSKVVIDASNIVSVGFYNAITSNTSTLSGSNVLGSRADRNLRGISAGYMNMLGMQTFYSADILNARPNGVALSPTQILIIGIMSSVFMLITAVMLLIAGIMFTARFIILVFLMILSPLALVAYIIPGAKGQFEKWKEALLNQSFFAPLYFALTWVVFRLGTSLLTAFRTSQNLGATQNDSLINMFVNPAGSVSLIINYVLIIGFSIAALVFAKQMATSGAMAKPFKAIAGGIGGAAIGGAAWVGRQSVGRIGTALAGTASLQKAAKEKTGPVGAGARLALYASQKAKSGTFDARNAKIPTNVVGDVIEGTVGRTGVGKKLGLNDVPISSVAMGSIVGLDEGMSILGKGGTRGYAEGKAESDKRVRDREAKAASELAIAQAKKDILKGAGAVPGTPQFDAMEKALTKLSEKETETLVSNNRDLLESLNFANTISVKQLEAINKSDQFSDEEKGRLKRSRFKDIEAIDDAAGLAALAVPVATRTTVQAAAAARVEKARSRVKGLSDSELEMIDSIYLDPNRQEGKEFISQLKGGQVDAINKSNKFSSTQKDGVKKEKARPLLEAISTGNATIAQSIVRKSNVKTQVGFMKPQGTPPVIIATHPDVLPVYTAKMLQKMAVHDDMSDDDIHTLRLAILGPTGTGAPGVNPATVTWLLNPDKGGTDFP